MLMAVDDPKLKALAQVPLFSRLTRKELQFTASEGDEANIPSGKTLTRQGRPGDTFYVLLKGAAEARIDGKSPRLRKPGDVFGEITMMRRGPPPATRTPPADA